MFREFVALLGALGCIAGCSACETDGESFAETAPGSATVVASALGSSTATSPPPANEPTAALGDAQDDRSFAWWRAQAESDPESFEERVVMLDAYFAHLTQKIVGTGEHPRHQWAVVHIALDSGLRDTMECHFATDRWPPKLERGDPIRVRGVWTFDRILSGGIAPGGGELHIKRCEITLRQGR